MKTLQKLKELSATPSGNPARIKESELSFLDDQAFEALQKKNVITPWGQICVNMFDTTINNWKYENAYKINLQNL